MMWALIILMPLFIFLEIWLNFPSCFHVITLWPLFFWPFTTDHYVSFAAIFQTYTYLTTDMVINYFIYNMSKVTEPWQLIMRNKAQLARGSWITFWASKINLDFLYLNPKYYCKDCRTLPLKTGVLIQVLNLCRFWNGKHSWFTK